MTNPKLVTMLGYSSFEEISDQNLEQDGFEPSYERKQFIDQIEMDGEVKGLEASWTRKDGTILHIRESARVIRDTTGKTLYYDGTVEDITERKRAIDKLRESEETFRNLFENTADPILLLTDSGFTDCNRSTVDLLGYSSKAEFLNKQPWELSPERQPDGMLSTEKARTMISMALKKGFNRFEWMHTKSDGTNLPVEVMLTPIILEGKQFFYTMWRDITERLLTQQKIKNSEERFRSVWENSIDGMRITDKEGTIIAVNNAYCRLVGVKNEEIIGRSFNSLYTYSEDDDQIAVQNYKDKFSSRTISQNQEGVLHLNSGTMPIVEISNSFLDTERNEPMLLSIFRDITERKKAEDEIKKSENKFRELFDNAPIGYHEIDTEGKIVSINRTELEMLGYTLEEMVGRYVWEFSLDNKHSRTRVENKLTGVQPLNKNSEQSIVRKDGTVIQIMVDERLILNHQQKVTGIRTVLQDLTEKKRIESELIESERLLNESQKVSRIGSYSLDITSGIWKSSRVLNEIFGINNNDDHSVQGWIAIVHPEDQLALSEYFANDVFKKKGRFDKEYRIIPKDTKTERWVHGIGELEMDVNDNPIKMIGTIQDITEWKRSEELLRDNEERLRLSLQAGNQGLFDQNVQTGETFTNREYATMLGYDPATFVETNEFWIERLHPDDKERTAQVYIDYVTGKLNEYRVEFRQRTKSGAWKWILSNGKITEYTADGKPLRMIGTHTDIDELKQALEMQKMQTTALESAANGVAITDTPFQKHVPSPN